MKNEGKLFPGDLFCQKLQVKFSVTNVITQAARERELRSRGLEGTEEELEVSRRAWEVNYREAAIFLEEGQNNDKFIHHPRYSVNCVKFF